MRFPHATTCLLILGLLIGCTPRESSGPQDSPAEGGPQQPGVTAGEQAEKENETNVPVDTEKVREELSEAGRAVMEYSEQESKEAYEAARARLDHVKSRLAELKERAGAKQETATIRLQESLDSLEGKLHEAEQQLNRLGEAGADAWSESKDERQKAMDALESAYQEAARAFEKSMSERPGETEPGDAHSVKPPESQDAGGAEEDS